MKFHMIKLFWGVRALIYKPFMGKLKLPSYMGKPIFIDGRRNIYIGKRVRIFPGIRMEAFGNGKIIIGNNVAIEQNVHITSGGGVLQIGSDVTILANTFITNLDHEYSDITKSVMEQGCIIKETSIGDGCFIGSGAAVQAGTKLGKHCVVGANTVVRGEFPDYCVVVGIPGKVIKRFNLQTEKWEKYCEKVNI